MIITGVAVTGCDSNDGKDRIEEENVEKNVEENVVANTEGNSEETIVGLRFVASSGNAQTKSAAETSGQEDVVFFVDDDLLWYNEQTGEMRFKNRLPPIDTLIMKILKFYLGDEYLFSSVITTWVNGGFQSEICNSLIFYYTAPENKYFLKDGYPDAATIPDKAGIQEIRDENMKKIERQWKRFIEKLKEEGKYKEEE
jgi:hypothetical protein